MNCEQFECAACKARPNAYGCIYCGGDGIITREVWDTEDRMLHMARIVRADGIPRRTVLPPHLASRVLVQPKQYKVKRRLQSLPALKGEVRHMIPVSEPTPFDKEAHRSSRHYKSSFTL